MRSTRDSTDDDDDAPSGFQLRAHGGLMPHNRGEDFASSRLATFYVASRQIFRCHGDVRASLFRSDSVHF